MIKAGICNRFSRSYLHPLQWEFQPEFLTAPLLCFATLFLEEQLLNRKLILNIKLSFRIKFGSTSANKAGNEPIMGPGPGKQDPRLREVPTNFEHAVGIERLEMLSEMMGEPVDINTPLKVTKLGSLDSPTMVPTVDHHERIIGCSGFPAESHEINWVTATMESLGRCVICGHVFKLYDANEKQQHKH